MGLLIMEGLAAKFVAGEQVLLRNEFIRKIFQSLNPVLERTLHFALIFSKILCRHCKYIFFSITYRLTKLVFVTRKPYRWVLPAWLIFFINTRLRIKSSLHLLRRWGKMRAFPSTCTKITACRAICQWYQRRLSFDCQVGERQLHCKKKQSLRWNSIIFFLCEYVHSPSWTSAFHAQTIEILGGFVVAICWKASINVLLSTIAGLSCHIKERLTNNHKRAVMFSYAYQLSTLLGSLRGHLIESDGHCLHLRSELCAVQDKLDHNKIVISALAANHFHLTNGRRSFASRINKELESVLGHLRDVFVATLFRHLFIRCTFVVCPLQS